MGSRIVAVLLLVLSTCTSQTLGLSSGDLRLIGGTSRGRLEIFYNGVWGTVCDDLFGANEAESACRQLGFFGYSRYDDVDDLGYSRGTGTIWLDDVDCTNTRTPLLQCRHNSLGSHNCGHNEDVALVCITTPLSGDLRLVGSSSSSGRGRLEIYWSRQWGTVCDDGFGTTDANVACRQLAFSGATRNGNVVTLGYSRGTGIIWLTNVACSTSSTMLRLCRSTGLFSGGVTSCTHNEDVALECFISSSSGSGSGSSTFVNIGGIIGGVIGGLVGLGFLIFFCIICCVACSANNARSRRSRTVAPPQPAAYTVVTTSNQGGMAMQQPASYPVQQYNANPQEPPAAYMYPKNSELQSAPPPSYNAAVQHYPPASSTAGGGVYPSQTQQAPASYPTAYPPTQIPGQYPDSNAPLPGQHPDPAYLPAQPQGIPAPHSADAYPPGAPPPSAPPPSF